MKRRGELGQIQRGDAPAVEFPLWIAGPCTIPITLSILYRFPRLSQADFARARKGCGGKHGVR